MDQNSRRGFIQKAFEYARKYADEDVLLFYNDYDTFKPWKRELICQLILEPLAELGLVDGMGMQTHLSMTNPRLQDYEDSLLTFGSLVDYIHITEMDIHNNDASEDSQNALAARYKALFSLILQAKAKNAANVTSVTFWGANDAWTWLSGFRKEKSYPLLFDEANQPKKAYYSVVGLVEQQ